MARTFEYAVLTAIPDPRRGERVNVGVIVFRPDRVDVRFIHAQYKLRALTGDAMGARLESAEARFQKMFRPEQTAAELVRRYQSVEPLLHVSDLGWFEANDDGAYDERVSEIIHSLVAIPKRPQTVETKSRINTEMTKEFKQKKILAGRDEGLASHKVVRAYPLGGEENLTADFALQNGRLHITSTLDLRKQVAGMGEAALKSIILDRAKTLKRAKTLGVYVIDAGMYDNFRPHIALFHEYADELFDWGDPNSRKKLNRYLFDAIGSEGDLL
jgi:hypothetical protein